MSDPFMEIAAAIATTASGKATEAVLNFGRKASQALVTMVKERFGGEPMGRAALEAAVEDPEKNHGMLAQALALAATADPAFGDRLKAEYERGEPTIVAGPGSVVNSNSGTVHGSLFQVGRSWNGPDPSA
ncbi:MAG TPA: hypothetical protein H9881_06865 [Candidatus Stackebrandtia excrementipullorum]|nr:hypothetical protein [Candidatus Stackebrandtia excrementipullorum]